MRWLMRLLLGGPDEDPMTKRVDEKVDKARSALSASTKATEEYWDARRKELSVVDAQIDARRRRGK